ncbi:translation elongation factor Ts [Candidatus Nomurabacteria bacterium RIFCSPHIGHO2_01_FULL_39_220]|uniref:Elongation factor Ts n=1 Tax=Candidatus Nomurabacteria bacterium RIFCSPLOWO2_02_FULL_40_67 TaxID=1801787 RepID=A0A1F6Y3T4_9BACT|nr:MAG: Elongation factor Ts [Parcubacteria group bacterium GW2011_GWA2_40_37]OGI69345.1 MAG: translation elongation factor Ts [Candidatus Nomurabacteria bacterium RIFCSPHIGHO2_01_FULL_39_220]OGI72832.1 MAG: translation elongation factor Ts [Candidatus Nomurabacteria bacterium RIFCSPHIGHO2_02_41_18]OGI78326.1 MAG: translation elongation factor Ts [Candidatus Nomurabacteria bacterium RIFCSPHIGHO2_02_FULL_41_150]OGI81230.1 MAG: translation elongation factor Ts [Candidatus Nomurabacteria bacterium
MPLSITTEIIKELRDATGISVMQCKHALEEAEGDMKKALAILKKTSSDIALKKGSREVKDGAVTIKLKDLPAQAGKKAVLVSLLCETDFVARNEDFTTLLGKLADIALSKGLEKMKVLAKDLIDPIIQKTGENIQLGDAYEVSNKDKGYLGSYVHNNKIAVITSLEGGSAELARDIAMHIAAMKPEYITSEEITPDTKQTITEVFQKEIALIDKPEEIKKKILDGKIGTYFKEKTLSEQAFIKDSGETVGHLLQKNKAKIKEIRQCSV